jgi:hypothetical protein
MNNFSERTLTVSALRGPVLPPEYVLSYLSELSHPVLSNDYILNWDQVVYQKLLGGSEHALWGQFAFTNCYTPHVSMAMSLTQLQQLKHREQRAALNLIGGGEGGDEEGDKGKEDDDDMTEGVSKKRNYLGQKK